MTLVFFSKDNLEHVFEKLGLEFSVNKAASSLDIAFFVDPDSSAMFQNPFSKRDQRHTCFGRLLVLEVPKCA